MMGNLREGHVGKGSYDRGPIFFVGSFEGGTPQGGHLDQICL